MGTLLRQGSSRTPCRGLDSRYFSPPAPRPSRATPMRHPLEPLSAAEVQQAVRLLRDAGKVTPTTRFVSVGLREPNKDHVHGFPDLPAPSREASVVLFDNGTNTAHEAVVSLAAGRVASFRSTAGAQPTMTVDEQVDCEQAA